MRSITTLNLQYAHRFYGFKGEAQYLHGHTGTLTIEVEDTINPGVNMVFPCNEIKKTAWNVLKNFDHALILREDDPLLPAIVGVYEEQGIKNGHPQNTMKGEAFDTAWAKAYPDCRLVVTKETMTVEGMIKIVYDLLKDKLNIAKLTFTSGDNAASQEYILTECTENNEYIGKKNSMDIDWKECMESNEYMGQKEPRDRKKCTETRECTGKNKCMDRCPLCGIALDESGVCHKCGYQKSSEDMKRPQKTLEDMM